MLHVSISKIPSDGLDLDEAVTGDVLALEGSDLTLSEDGRFRARVEKGDASSIHVRGRLDLETTGPCARCLSETRVPVRQEMDLFFLPEDEARADLDDEEGTELQDRDLVVSFYRGDVLDLEALVREQVLLAQPMKRLCRPDCKGVCPRCGADLNAGPCSCPKEERRDSPFAALSLLTGGGGAKDKKVP